MTAPATDALMQLKPYVLLPESPQGKRTLALLKTLPDGQQAKLLAALGKYETTVETLAKTVEGFPDAYFRHPGIQLLQKSDGIRFRLFPEEFLRDVPERDDGSFKEIERAGILKGLLLAANTKSHARAPRFLCEKSKDFGFDDMFINLSGTFGYAIEFPGIDDLSLTVNEFAKTHTHKKPPRIAVSKNTVEEPSAKTDAASR